MLVEILRGAADKAAEAGIAIVGGHTIKSEEPIFGLAVIGKVAPDRVLSNDKAQPGDVLILTKPLGLGIITTAAKNGEDKLGAIGDAIRVMTTLNRVAGEEIVRVRCSCTDGRDRIRPAGPLAKCRRGQQSGCAHLFRSSAGAAGCARICAGRHLAGRHARESQVSRRLGELRRRRDQGGATYSCATRRRRAACWPLSRPIRRRRWSLRLRARGVAEAVAIGRIESDNPGRIVVSRTATH